MIELDDIPLTADSLGLDPGNAESVTAAGRPALRFREAFRAPIVPGLELAEGVIELDLIVPAERSFHGVTWHARGEDYESFFVRPHQVGNPDAIQYTPVPNGISSWQLYHGPGYGAPIVFPMGDWFTIRVEIAAGRADIYVADPAAPALAVRSLLLGASTGGLGVLVSGPGLHVGRLAVGHGRPTLSGTPPPEPITAPGTVTTWVVSDAFPEAELEGATELPVALVAARRWTSLDTEPGGLANLGRVNGLVEDRNTVLARAAIESRGTTVRPVQIGFSDRATVYLNGRAMFRGEDGYRSRDYRFLGTIGWWDTLYLPLDDGPNDLVIAVSEDFGGWGVQARLPD